MHGEQVLADKGKSNEEECNAEEEPGKREHPDKRFETEEEAPNDRITEEDRANDVKLDISLPTRTKEQNNLMTGSRSISGNNQLSQ